MNRKKAGKKEHEESEKGGLAFRCGSVNISPMKKILLLLLPAFVLSGCIGAYISGQTELLDEETPDITTVPCRQEAAADRGAHDAPESAARQQSVRELDAAKRQVKAQDQRLRDQYF